MGLDREERQQRTRVRIWSGDIPIGMGFVVGPRHVMTCAHVVADSLDLREELQDCWEPPLDRPVELDMFIAPGQRLSARIMPGKWRPEQRDADGDDVAVLMLEEGQQFPERALPAGRGGPPRKGDILDGYGVGVDRPRGSNISAEYTGFGTSNRHDIRAFDEDEAIRPGCSGGALWSRRGGIVGMVVERDLQKSGHFVPAEILAQVYPLPAEGDVQRRRPRSPGAGRRASNLALQLQDRLRSFDRIEQVDRFKLLLRDQWDSNRKPVVCIIAGLAPDHPEWCRDRCQDEGVNPRLAKMKVDASAVLPLELAWPRDAEFGLDLHFDLLLNKVRDLLDARNARPETIRTAFNRASQPFLFHSLVPESAVRGGGDRHIELLRRWMDFWRIVGAGRLKRPFVHFLVLRLDPAPGGSETGEASCRAFYDRLLAGLGVDERDSLPLLRGAFELDEVDQWLRKVGRELQLDASKLSRVQQEARGLFKRVPAPRLADLETWLDELSL